MTVYEVDKFFSPYWFNKHGLTPDISTRVSSENADPRDHYSMDQLEQMLDGDNFEGITIGGHPIDGFYNYVTMKGDLIVLNRDIERFKPYTIKCD